MPLRRQDSAYARRRTTVRKYDCPPTQRTDVYIPHLFAKDLKFPFFFFFNSTCFFTKGKSVEIGSNKLTIIDASLSGLR